MIFITVLTTSCWNKKIILKKIIDDEITIRWYYYSYISNNSDEIVELEKDKMTIVISKLDGNTIQDINVLNDTIFIKRYEVEELYDTDILLNGSVLGYRIKYVVIKN